MRFYVINMHRFEDKEYAYGEQLDHNTGDSDKCDACGSSISMRKWLPPLTVKLSTPSYGDFVFGTFTTFLVSERFIDEYKKSNLTGIKEFESVEVLKVNRKHKSNNAPPKYYYVLIERSKAKIDEKLSNIVRDGDINCDFCRVGGVIKTLDGIVFERNTWSGEDIFFPIGLAGTIVVSEKFVDFTKEHHFSNINFTPAEEFQPSWVAILSKNNNRKLHT